MTGASSGIGYSFSKQIAQKNVNLILQGRNLDRLKAAKAQCEALSMGEVKIIQTELNTVTDCETFAAQCHEIGDIENFVHCVGIGDFTDTLKQTNKQIEKILRINLLCAAILAQEFARIMLDQELFSMNITVVSSVSALMHTPRAALYSASKAGLYAFCNGLRQDLWKTPITVTCVLPGPVKTPFFDTATNSADYAKKVAKIMVTPEKVAKKMLQAIEQQKYEVITPCYFSLLRKCQGMFPVMTYRLIHLFFNVTKMREEEV